MPLLPSDSLRLSFTEADLELFSQASGDRNPLHLSPEYARRTSYGRQVLFGALGAMAALGHVPTEISRRIASVQADFYRPLFLGIEYQIRVTPQPAGILVRLFDGSSPVVSLLVKTSDQPWPSTGDAEEGPGEFPLDRAMFRTPEELAVGLRASGRYRASSPALRQLKETWQVSAPDAVVEILLWSSYLVGMELPGEAALFFRFNATFESRPSSTGFDYDAALAHIDPRLGQLRIQAALTAAGQGIASAECRAFVRPSAPALDRNQLSSVLPASNSWEGKTALIIGASRGLGASLAAAHASQGEHVLALSRSAGGDQENIEYVACDATDPKALRELEQKVRTQHQRLDHLVCNAYPALLPLILENNSFTRIQEYIQQATALTLGPMCTFLELLSESQGTLILISSVAVQQPVKEWPHYIAAKRAAESLAELASLQYPGIGVLIVRPERMLTEMTNTPLGRRNALAPEQMAMRIINRLKDGVSGLAWLS